MMDGKSYSKSVSNMNGASGSRMRRKGVGSRIMGMRSRLSSPSRRKYKTAIQSFDPSGARGGSMGRLASKTSKKMGKGSRLRGLLSKWRSRRKMRKSGGSSGEKMAGGSKRRSGGRRSSFLRSFRMRRSRRMGRGRRKVA